MPRSLSENRNLLASISFDGSEYSIKELSNSYQILEAQLGTKHYRVTKARLMLESLGIAIKKNTN